MSEQKTEHNVFYITHKLELLIWLLIILLIITISTAINKINNREVNYYTIFMSDIDGLIEGSPVRMMGIEVGYVTKIKPTNEDVYIKFLITDKNISIPQGTFATVEFNGMAGSKSLELYLPDKTTYIDKNIPIITVNPPKRLHDAVGLLNEMFDKLGSIIYASSSFGDKMKFISIPKDGDSQNFTKFLHYADSMVDKSNKRVNDLNKKLTEYKIKE